MRTTGSRERPGETGKGTISGGYRAFLVTSIDEDAAQPGGDESNTNMPAIAASGVPAAAGVGTGSGEHVDVTVGAETFRLSPDAAAFLGAAAAENTKRAYAGDFRHFVRWCERQGRASMPATPADIANYLAELAVGTTGTDDGGERRVRQVLPRSCRGHPDTSRTVSAAVSL